MSKEITLKLDMEVSKEEMVKITTVLGNPKKGRIIKELLHASDGLNFNEICRKLGGSKSTVNRLLIEMTDIDELKVLNNKTEKQKKDRQYRHYSIYEINPRFFEIFRALQSFLIAPQ